MNELKITNIGGTEVQKNLFVYEYKDEALLVDCGIGFPDTEDYGVDILIPDFDYVLSIKDKVKGLVITHGHYDHFSAAPYLLKDMPLKIYAHPLVQDFLMDSIKEHSDLRDYELVDIDGDSEFQVGNNFNIIPYRVNHSVPNALGFFINTPSGTVVHQSDFKFDWTPVMDKPADVQKIASLAERYEPELLLSDCLGANREGFTRSEKYIESTFDDVLDEAHGQVFITTVSSNISRIQQAINSAKKHSRKVAPIGYSVENVMDIALKNDLIEDPNNTIIDKDQIKNHKDSELVIIIAGSYGQVGSNLDRLSRQDNRYVSLHEDAVVVFSADPIPGSEPNVNNVIDRLTLLGARVVYTEMQEDLHVSGHGSRGDLILMANLVNAGHVAPIGGNMKHMRAYKDIMIGQGYKPNEVFEVLGGEALEITKDQVKKLDGRLDLREIFIDNQQMDNEIEGIVLKDRELIANNGVIFVVVPYKDGSPQLGKSNIYTRGFIHVKESQSLLSGMRKNVDSTIKSLKGSDDGKTDFGTVKNAVQKALSKHLYKRVGTNPMIVVEKLEV